MARKGNGNGSHYSSVNRSEVPHDRKGKHRKAVGDILADLAKLNAKQTIKVPLSSLNGEKMQNLRSALNRATREKDMPVETSSDEKYLYVWRADPPKNTGAPEKRAPNPGWLESRLAGSALLTPAAWRVRRIRRTSLFAQQACDCESPASCGKTNFTYLSG
jgi:hypothetical protein